MKQVLRELHAGFYRVLEVIMVVCMLVMFVLVFINVMMRIFLNSGIDVSEELPRYAFVWMTFVGAVIGMRKHAHLGVDMLVAALPVFGRKVCWGISQVIMAVCSVYMLYGTWLQHDIIAANASPVMQKYSPSAYADAYNTLESYQAAVKKLKDAGYYVIGRITAFNDPNLAADHPECVVADLSGRPLKIGGMYWPSVYSRQVWQYKVDLALEAAETMGITAARLKTLGLVDKVVHEPTGGAHRDHAAMAQSLKKSLQDALKQVSGMSTAELLETRFERLMAYGRFKEEDPR